MSKFLLFLFMAYVAGVLVALIRERVVGRRIRGFLPLLIGLIFAYSTYSASATAQYASAAVLYLAFFGLALPISGYGVGALLTSVGAFLPSTILGQCIRIGIVAAPVLFVAFELNKANERLDDRERQVADQQFSFQMTDIQGTLAGLSVVLPGSPQIDLYHACYGAATVSRRTCRTYFPTATRLRINDEGVLPISVKQLFINPTNAATTGWCDQRQDMENRVWCNESWNHSIRLTDTFAPPLDEHWTEIIDVPNGLNIFCSEGGNGSLCQSHYTVAPDVFARGWFENVDPERIIPIATDLQRVSNLIWQDITRTP